MIRKLFAEALGTAFLLIAIIGSGLYGQTLSDQGSGIALLSSALATGCILYVLITCLGPVSGGHLNPAVSFAFFLRGQMEGRAFLSYAAVQIIGAVIGVWLAHYMYGADLFQVSPKPRDTANLWFSEFLGTFGLLFVIFGGLRHNASVPALVALYITGAYWFMSSTSFANPAVTVARIAADETIGIAAPSAVGFVVCQLIAVFVAHKTLKWLFAED